VGGARELHWREYGMEAAQLGGFMVSALFFVTLLEHPASSVHASLRDPLLRRVLTGLAMGSTAVALIYSPWGKRSGAHLNPAVTLTFWMLGRIRGSDAVGYTVAQFAGGAAAVVAASWAAGQLLGDPAVRYAATVPGAAGTAVAFAAESLLAFVLMSVVLQLLARARWEHRTGWIVGLLVALYISVEAPLSGMSMNPARTFASALGADLWSGWWVYFLAPPLGMLGAAAFHSKVAGSRGGCAKLCHSPAVRCLFCGHEPLRVADTNLGDRSAA
jgi:aquaporin Z